MASKKSIFKNPLLKAQKASRNGFDLGHKRAFHVSLGQIVPVFHADVPAGSYVEIGEENQTYNMNPIVRPAFCRVKEHIDYFAVPKVQLWSLYDNFITGQSQFMSSALGDCFLAGGRNMESVPSQLPMFDGNFLKEVLGYKFSINNPFGVSQINDTLKLLDLLGYGNIRQYSIGSATQQDIEQVYGTYVAPYYLPQNFMNLLAYQKIYYSYFRNSKYEANIPTAYNLDWLPSSKLNLSTGDFVAQDFNDIFTLHYRWLNKDYFMNSNPSVLPISSDIGFTGLSSLLQDGVNGSTNFWQLFSIPGGNYTSFRGAQVLTGNSNISQNAGEKVGLRDAGSTSASNTNITAIRFAFAFDKLLRRMRSAGATFDDQMLAQFGIKPIDQRHGDAFWLGGFTNRLNFAEVTQTSGSAGSGLGSFGANISKYSSNPKKIKYHAKEDCIIMGIYSTSYDVDYASSRYERDNLRRFRFDHFNPSFENLGLQALYQGELSFISDQTPYGDFDSHAISSKSVATDLLGFGKRYLEYKTKLDTVNGLFDYSQDNPTMNAWTTQYRALSYDSSGQLVQNNNRPLSMPLMLVNPIILNGIVTTDYSGEWENDHFMVNLYNDCTMIANMSVEGEIY